MADASGQALIRGIDIDKLAKGYADEELVLKRYVTVSATQAREIRWYQKTSGFLDSVDTTAITASQIYNVPDKALPTVVEQSWARKTSYVKNFKVESPWISEEDIMDSDVGILATNTRDLTRAVQKQVDVRIYNVMSESLSPSTINTAAATGTGWDDATNGNPIKDIMTGLTNIRSAGYNTNNIVLYIHPTEHRMLIEYLIVQKGANIPTFSSERVSDGAVQTVLGCQVVVSANATTDYALMFVNQRACTWKAFSPIEAHVIEEKGIGKKIRILERGEALLTDPSAVHLITDTTT